MGYILSDLGNGDRVLRPDEGEWNAAMAQLRRWGVLGVQQQLEYDGSGAVEITARQAREIARRLRHELLPALGADGRVDIEGQIIHQPEDPTRRRDPREAVARADFLGRLAEFCEACDGFFVS